MTASASQKLHPLIRLLPLLALYRWQVGLFLFLGVSASLVEGVGIGMMIPLLEGKPAATASPSPVLRWIDGLATAFPAEQRIGYLSLLMLGAILLKAALAYSYTCLVAWIESDVQHRLRTGMFRQLLSVSQAYLDAQEGGKLLRTLTIGPKETAAAIAASLWLMLNVSTLLVFSALLMAIAWQLTLSVVATLLVVFNLVRRATGKVTRLGQGLLNADRQLGQLCKEGLSGMRSIRAFGREDYEEQRFVQASQRSRRAQTRQRALMALARPLTEGLVAAVMVGLVYTTLQAHFSLPLLVTMAFMLYRLQPQFQTGNVNLTQMAAFDPQVAEVQALLAETGKPCARPGGKPFSKLRQGIRFDRVSFSYAGRPPALQDIDLEIALGKTTALVGRSGAGKSTLLNLVGRFYEPGSGRIWVDGVPLAELDVRAWRGRIALVSQDAHVFGASIRENIAYGKLDASAAEIVAAARRAHADEFIGKFPQAYDTLVGDSGTCLSGGQRQRLSIARAILRDPDILILDEATNALDSLSEAHIQASIEELGRDRTVIVVAHRLSTIRRADKVVVLEQGRVAEQGRFDELLARGGLFAALYRSHQLGLAEETMEEAQP